MRSGSTCGEKDLIQRVRETLHGVSGIFICLIRMATSVICASDLAVFQQPQKLIVIEEQFAKRHAQHWWAHVLSGIRFPE